jgi:hypothetical protein
VEKFFVFCFLRVCGKGDIFGDEKCVCDL